MQYTCGHIRKSYQLNYTRPQVYFFCLSFRKNLLPLQMVIQKIDTMTPVQNISIFADHKKADKLHFCYWFVTQKKIMLHNTLNINMI